MLTRPQMEQVIREGGSVSIGGHVISRIQDLPTAAALAKGNPEAETAAANTIQQQIADLQSQLDDLRANQSAPSTPGAGAPSTTESPLVQTFGQQIADRLIGAGFDTLEALRAASDEQLLGIEGIGDGTLKKIRAS